ncbi:Ion channel [Tranquillimonas rosea]|uniref:Ion channel n=1 Tax=Tranquillimonas rosea TaxID=641238 RepID=A0A1H9QYN5_9RHOB|nr:ion channel [Tranquillimonas rosea]SER64813.1 Ion channel [Tranquillimonas rosea]
MGLIVGFILVAVMGVIHHFGLRALERISGYDKWQPNRTILTVFMGLLVLHTAEILLWAVAYLALQSDPLRPVFGQLIQTGGRTFGDLVYFSGMSFVTLGYTEMKSAGAIRLVGLMQSLGGFMVLTWSATYIYSAWQRAFRLAGQTG